MLKTRRHTPQFDVLEGKVLLSTGMADPAIARDGQVAKRVDLNGTLRGLPSGSTGTLGFTVTSFLVGGSVSKLGKVNGAVNLADKIIPFGMLPDLSSTALVLANQKGSVVLLISPSKTNRYRFSVVGGTGEDSGATGSGSLKISSGHNSFEFKITLHSTG